MLRFSALAAPLLLACILGGCSAETPSETVSSPVESVPPPSLPAAVNPPSSPPPSLAGEGVERGDPAPPFTLPLVGGKAGATLSLSQVIGPAASPEVKGAIVGFVASWCGRCTESLPALASLEAQHGDRLRIVLLATDEGEEERRKEAEKVKAAGLKAPVLDAVSTPGVLNAWLGQKRNIPRFYLVDKTSTVRVKDTGFGQKMARLLPRQVEWLLNRSDAPASSSGETGAVSSGEEQGG